MAMIKYRGRISFLNKKGPLKTSGPSLGRKRQGGEALGKGDPGYGLNCGKSSHRILKAQGVVKIQQA